MRRTGFTLVDLLIVIGAAGVLAIIFVPPYLKSRKHDTLGAALRAYHSIQEAEDALYSNDLDGNMQMDYWTRDVRSLAAFHAKGMTAGLIDDGMAAADAGHANPRPRFGHIFLMIERDEEGQPLADATGRGPRLIYSMYPAQPWDFDHTWVRVRDHCWYSHRDGGVPLRQWLKRPAADGWAIVD